MKEAHLIKVIFDTFPFGPFPLFLVSPLVSLAVFLRDGPVFQNST